MSFSLLLLTRDKTLAHKRAHGPVLLLNANNPQFHVLGNEPSGGERRSCISPITDASSRSSPGLDGSQMRLGLSSFVALHLFVLVFCFFSSIQKQKIQKRGGAWKPEARRTPPPRVTTFPWTGETRRHLRATCDVTHPHLLFALRTW